MNLTVARLPTNDKYAPTVIGIPTDVVGAVPSSRHHTVAVSAVTTANDAPVGTVNPVDADGVNCWYPRGFPPPPTTSVPGAAISSSPTMGQTFAQTPGSAARMDP